MSMRTTFLGTGGTVPTTARAPSAFLMNRDGEYLLFGYEEGTQRQMMCYGTRLGVSHLFVIHLHGDHIFGVPGSIQTLDFNDRDDPSAIHGPLGSKGHLEQLVHVDDYQSGFHVSVHEVRSENVAYRTDDYEVHAFDIEHRTASVGYVLVEDNRPGRFDCEKAGEFGIPADPTSGHLHAGEDIELGDGTVVRSEQVVDDPRPGRTVVCTGDTRPLNSAVEVARDADLFVHDVTFIDEEAERAKQTAHSTVREAARIVRDADVRRLTLVHIFVQYAADLSPLLKQTRKVYDGEAPVAEDGQKLEVPYADSDGGGAETGE